MRKNDILGALWILALLAISVSVIAIAESPECLPVVPCVIAIAGLVYLTLFYIANNG